ncbi:hypothetical protein Pta02_68860 [Planobispora takensis]|uniref:Uncharacterized protein n=1 Tax=Planobispora takensis TaxID=1367882 RepID=A0A8J3T645_9ACTN|nr:hypothetical protein Pta02_68860 [Planobispora takensis]
MEEPCGGEHAAGGAAEETGDPVVAGDGNGAVCGMAQTTAADDKAVGGRYTRMPGI